MTNKEFCTDGVQLSIECGSLISDNLQSKKPIPTRIALFLSSLNFQENKSFAQ